MSGLVSVASFCRVLSLGLGGRHEWFAIVFSCFSRFRDLIVGVQLIWFYYGSKILLLE